MRLYTNELSDILGDLPEICRFSQPGCASWEKDDLFVAALGFEERGLAFPRSLRAAGYRTERAVYCQYKTNRADNEVNLPELQDCLESASNTVVSIGADSPKFTNFLLSELEKSIAKSDVPRVTVDISVMANRLLSRCLKVLIEQDIELRILYSEAAVYYPSHDEYTNNPEEWSSEDGLALERGVGDVVTSINHPGNHLDLLPNTIVLFPSFKIDRSRAVISKIDPSLLATPGEQLIWIIGIPRLADDQWRTEAMRRSNQIDSACLQLAASTFEYKDTLKVLERIWIERAMRSNISISPLGSKMQGVGLALFMYQHPDVRIEFASPKEYTASAYSLGCKAQWILRLGDTRELRKLLDSVGELRLVDDHTARPAQAG